MKSRTAKSMELYDILIRRGYPEPFCNEITKNLNTDWTAQRMIGYLSHYKKLPMEEIADEMLAIDVYKRQGYKRCVKIKSVGHAESR